MRLTATEARRFLLSHLGLRRTIGRGAAGVRALLARLRCIQLDPLDPMGTNADLVALARVDGIARGDVYRHLYPGHAFEHFAKERCLLPASAFPYYRDRLTEVSWWSLDEQKRRVPPNVVEAVLAAVSDRGPLGTDDLDDHGAVEAIDWSGWKSTGKAASMALHVLWTQCRVVVCGRRGKGKLYDVPARALPKHAAAKSGDFESWALAERVHAAGLLCRAGGAHWSMLSDVRKGPMPSRLLDAGVIEEVEIEGSPRRYLAPAGFRDVKLDRWDGKTRILGPLDPLIWDRKLVAHVFGFDYIWEVYKPPAQRRWGWYVCPVLQDDRFVARLEGRVDDETRTLRIDRIWKERGAKIDPRGLADALERHAIACGATRVVRGKGARHV
jgi:uncharacterized protein YcaQ